MQDSIYTYDNECNMSKKITEKLNLGTNTLPRNMALTSIHY